MQNIKAHSTTLTATTRIRMMPISMLGLTKPPEEQGEWAGQVALKVLSGISPETIPVIANRRWDVWANEVLLSAAKLALPKRLIIKSKKITTL